MRKQRLLLACIVVATLAALAGSVYAWPRSDSTTLPPTVTVIVDHWGGTTPTATPANEPPAAYLRSAEGREVRGGLGS